MQDPSAKKLDKAEGLKKAGKGIGKGREGTGEGNGRAEGKGGDEPARRINDDGLGSQLKSRDA